MSLDYWGAEHLGEFAWLVEGVVVGCLSQILNLSIGPGTW